jgi:hypothetical protein
LLKPRVPSPHFGAAMGHEGLVGRQGGIEPGIPSGAAAVISALAEPFQVSGMAAAVEAFSEFIITAPLGTGKPRLSFRSWMRSYRAGARLPSSSRSVIGPSDRSLCSPRWSGARHFRASESSTLCSRPSWRLVLAVDGWNELDSNSRRRAAAEIRELQRNFPQLGVIIATRRQALDVPIRAQAVEIDILREDQQLEIARALRGVDGEVLLDHAWRASVSWFRSRSTSLRFLAHAPGSALPITKEEVLRLSWTNTRLAKRPLRCTTLFWFSPASIVGASPRKRRSEPTMSKHLEGLPPKHSRERGIIESRVRGFNRTSSNR